MGGNPFHWLLLEPDGLPPLSVARVWFRAGRERLGPVRPLSEPDETHRKADRHPLERTVSLERQTENGRRKCPTRHCQLWGLYSLERYKSLVDHWLLQQGNLLIFIITNYSLLIIIFIYRYSAVNTKSTKLILPTISQEIYGVDIQVTITPEEILGNYWLVL